MGDAEVVVRLDVPGRDGDCALELPDRGVEVAAILVEQPEIVVHLFARIALLEEQAVLHEGVVVVADPLVIQRQPEVVQAPARRTPMATALTASTPKRSNIVPGRREAGLASLEAETEAEAGPAWPTWTPAGGTAGEDATCWVGTGRAGWAGPAVAALLVACGACPAEADAGGRVGKAAEAGRRAVPAVTGRR